MNYYTTARAKIKVFPVCSHLCGQSGFWAGFSARKNPANDRVARGSGLWLFLSWIDGESLPNVACYQLHYTRIFGCHDYSTKTVRLKVFSCLYSFMWSKRFLGRLCCLEKSSKRLRYKGFRALAVPIVDRQGNAPKPPALPAAPHPDL